MKKNPVLLIAFSLLLCGCGQPEAVGETAQGDEFSTQAQTSTATAQPTETFTPEPASTPTINPTPAPPAVALSYVSRLTLVDELLVHPGGQVLALDISPDGTQMITGSSDCTTRIVDLQRGTLEKVFYLSSVGTFGTAFSSDGSYFISGNGYGDVWRVRNLSRAETMRAILSVPPVTEEEGKITSQTVLSVGGLVVASDLSATGFPLDPENNTDFLRPPSGANLVGLRFEKNDIDLWEEALTMENFPDLWKESFVDASLESPIWIWHISYENDLPAVFEAARAHAGAGVDTVASSQAEDIFAYGTGHFNGNVTVVSQVNSAGDWLGYQVPANSEGQYEQTEDIDFSPDGASFATGGDSNLVRIRDTTTGEMLAELVGQASRVFDVDYSADGRFLASTGCDGRVNVWDTCTWQLVQTVKHQGALRAVLSQSGDLLFSGGNGFMLKVWNVATGEELRTIEIPAAIKAMDWTPAGDILAVGAMDGKVRFYGLEHGY